MADEMLPPVIAALIADSAGFTEGVTEAQSALSDFAVRVDDLTGNVDAAFMGQGASAGKAAEAISDAAGVQEDAAERASTAAEAAAAAVSEAADSQVDSASRVAEAAAMSAAEQGTSGDRNIESYARQAAAAGAAADEQDAAADRAEAAQVKLAGVLSATADEAGVSAAKTAADAGASADEQADAAGRAAAAQVESAAKITAAQRAAGTAAAGAAAAAGESADGQAAASERAIAAQAALEAKTVESSNMFSTIGNRMESLGIPFASTFQKAGQSIDDADSKAGRFGTELSHIGGLMTLVGGGAAVYMGVKSVETFDQLDQAQTRLEVSVRNSGTAWDTYKPKLDAAYGSMEKVGWENTDVANTLQALTTATNSPTKALGDLTLASNLAREKNVSLTDAGQMLTRMYAGSNRAITQMGLNLDINSAKLSSIRTATQAVASAQSALKETQAEVNSGEYTGATAADMLAAAHQKVSQAETNLGKDQSTLSTITDALEQRTKGAAKTYGSTFAGEVDVAKASVHNLETGIGGELLPVLDTMLGDAESVVEFFEKDSTAAEALGIAIGVGLAVPVGAFAFNTAKSFILSLVSMGNSVVAAGAKVKSMIPTFAATDAAVDTTAETTATSAASVSTSTTSMTTSFSRVGASAQAMAGETAASTAEMKASLTEAAATSETEGEEIGAGMDAAMGPIGAVAIGVTALIPLFTHLFSSENQEAEAAQRVTTAKNAEVTAILNAHNATLSAESAFFALQSAQENVKSSQQAMDQAIAEHGKNSLQAQQATTQYKNSLVTVQQSESAYTASLNSAASAAEKQAASVQKSEAADKSQIATMQQHIVTLKTVLAGEQDVTAARGEAVQTAAQLRDAEDKLDQVQQQYNDDLNKQAIVTATAADQTLNISRATQGLGPIAGQTGEKVQALAGLYKSMPTSVQTKIDADPTDAQEKISAVVGDLEQAGVGKQQIITILGNTSSAQSALQHLTSMLDSLGTLGSSVGADIDSGLAAGISGNAGSVFSAAKALGDAATNATKDSLDSHSPSKVYEQIGKDIGDGLVAGIEGSTGKAQAAAAALVKAGAPPGGETISSAGSINEPASATTASALANSAPSAATAQADTAISSWASTTAQSVSTAMSNFASKAEAIIQAALPSDATEAQKKSAADQEAAVKSQATNVTNIAAKGSTDLNSMIQAIQSGSASQLNETMSGITEKQMTSLVSSLTATHSKALDSMAKDIESIWQQGMAAMAAANQTAANTQAASVAQTATSAAQQAVQDANQLATDQASGQAQAITDAAKVQADTIAENGLTGTALIAQQAQVALDKVTQTNDAAVSAAQVNLDQVTKAQDAAVAAAQATVTADSNSSALVQSQAAVNLANVQQAAQTAIGQASTLLNTAQNTATTQEAQAQAAQTVAAANSSNPSGGATITVNSYGTQPNAQDTAQQLYMLVRPLLTAA